MSSRGVRLFGFLGLFGILFVLNSYAIADGDYFWHLNTGQWIWEHFAIPSSDPFTFTVADSNPFRPDSGRVQFILKQYWLSQLVFYSFWKWGGEGSVVALRAVIHAFLISAVFVSAWRRADFYRALFFASLLFFYFQTVTNERPQLFTCLFAFLLVVLLERITSNSTLEMSRPYFFALPALMLIWANMHAGYALGICIIMAYAVVLFLEKRGSFDKPAKLMLMLMLGSVLIPVFNPAGLLSLLTELFSMKDSYQLQVKDSMSTFAWIRHDGIINNLPYIIMSSLAAVSLGVSFKQMRLAHLFTISGLLLISLMAVRHHVFLFLVAPLVAGYLPLISKLKLTVLISSFAFLGLMLLKVGIQKPLVFAANSNHPDGAIEFIRSTKPAPNVFNYYPWGGYLAHKIPEYQFFIDGRGLVEEHFDKHQELLQTENLSTLDEYQINTAIFPVFSFVEGKVFPLAVMLTYDPNWAAVFVGPNSLVFLRRTSGNIKVIQRHEIPQKLMFTVLITAYDMMLERHPNHYRALVTKAQIQKQVGDYPGARKALKRAQVVRPESNYPVEAMRRLNQKTIRLNPN